METWRAALWDKNKCFVKYPYIVSYPWWYRDWWTDSSGGVVIGGVVVRR